MKQEPRDLSELPGRWQSLVFQGKTMLLRLQRGLIEIGERPSKHPIGQDEVDSGLCHRGMRIAGASAGHDLGARGVRLNREGESTCFWLNFPRVSLDRRVLEEAIEVAEVLIGDVDILTVIAPVGGKVLDRFDLFFLKSAGGIFGMVKVVAQEIESTDGAIEGGTELLDEVVYPGFVEEVGVITRAGPHQDFKMREVFLSLPNNLHAGVFVVDRDDEDFGLAGSGGVKEFEAGGVAIVAREPEATEEVNVVTILLENGGHAANHTEETNDGVSKAPETSEDDFGMIVLDIGRGRVFRLGGAEFGKNDLLEKDEKDGREGHRERDRGNHLRSDGRAKNTLGHGESTQNEGEFTSLGEGDREKKALVERESEDPRKEEEDEALDCDEDEDEGRDREGL